MWCTGNSHTPLRKRGLDGWVIEGSWVVGEAVGIIAVAAVFHILAAAQ
jgi:hypothetical protein